MNIRSILCPTDFSEASAHAIDQAVIIAGWYQARITALHVLSPFFLAVPGLATARGEAVEPSEVERLRSETASRFGVATRAGTALDVLVHVL